MTRAQWGVLARLQRQEGMTQAEMAESPRDPADLAGAADRPLVPARPRRAAPASARPARQPALPDRQGAHDAWRISPRSASEVTSEVLASLSEADVAALPAEAAPDQDATSATPTGRRGAANGAQASCARGTRHERQHAHAAALLCRHDGCGRRRCASTLMVIVPALVAVGRAYSLSARRPLRVRPTTPTSAPRRCLITPEVSGKVVRIAVVEGQQLRAGRRAVLDRSRALSLRGAGGRGQARRASRATSTTSRARTPASASRSSWRARAWPPTRPTSTARPRCSSNRISTPSDLDKSRMALAGRQGACSSSSQQQEATVRNQLLGDVDLPIEKYPQYHRGGRGPRRAPSATSPTPCCARPSPASPRK